MGERLARAAFDVGLILAASVFARSVLRDVWEFDGGSMIGLLVFLGGPVWLVVVLGAASLVVLGALAGSSVFVIGVLSPGSSRVTTACLGFLAPLMLIFGPWHVCYCILLAIVVSDRELRSRRKGSSAGSEMSLKDSAWTSQDPRRETTLQIPDWPMAPGSAPVDPVG